MAAGDKQAKGAPTGRFTRGGWVSWRRAWRVSAAVVAVYLVPITAGWVPPTGPTDVVFNLAPAPSVPECSVNGPSRVVVLHGLLRSRWAMWRLCRTLENHGHDVLNFGYPSGSGTLEQHGERLDLAIRSRWGDASLGDASLGDAAQGEGIHLVGHSMGGLVAREWLRRPDRARALSLLCLGVPHKGAVLAEARHTLWAYPLVMGTKSAMQLRPGDPFHAKSEVLPGFVGCIAGGAGDGEGWNSDVPGDDDGTVSVAEALQPTGGEPTGAWAASDSFGSYATPPRASEVASRRHSIVLPVGHTRMTVADEVMRSALVWLKFLALHPPR